MSTTRIVVQEREQTTELDDEIRHAVEPEDRMLNLAQFRSANTTIKFRTKVARYPGRDLLEIVPEAIVIRERLRLEAEQKKQDIQARQAARKHRSKPKTAHRNSTPLNPGRAAPGSTSITSVRPVPISPMNSQVRAIFNIYSHRT